MSFLVSIWEGCGTAALYLAGACPEKLVSDNTEGSMVDEVLLSWPVSDWGCSLVLNRGSLSLAGGMPLFAFVSGSGAEEEP